MQLLVLTESITPRIRYIFTHILSEMLGFDVVFTQNIGDIATFNGPIIAYTHTQISDTVHITPHPLLTLYGVDEQSFAFFTWCSLPAFFATCNTSDIPFDLFAASFFLLTRYEEYLPHSLDAHGRFRVEDSIAFKMNFLEIPIVDLWVKQLGSIIKEKFPFVVLKSREFKFIPTIDIDNAFAYRHKGFVRALLGSGNALFRLRFIDLYRRILVSLRLLPDPYNTYKILFRVLSPFPQTVWFILGGKYSEYDKNIPLNKKPIRKLMDRIGRHFILGIHPSYGSYLSKDRLQSELDGLTQLSGKKVHASRQHFLRIKFPETYRILMELGIEQDYSVGYSNRVGFRAGTCTPFPFYDIIAEQQFPLTLIPFQVMDRSLLDGLKLTPEKAVEKTMEIAQKVKDVNGTFILAWHNESISGINEWKDWEDVLKEIVKGVNEMVIRKVVSSKPV